MYRRVTQHYVPRPPSPSSHFSTLIPSQSLLNPLTNSDRGGATALVTLSSHNLVIVLTQSQSLASPSVEVVCHVHTASNPLGVPHAPVLIECRGTHDTRLVIPCRLSNGISTAVGLESSQVLRPRAGVVGAVRLDDVVLNQRVGRPAIDSQVSVALGVERAAVVDGAGRAGLPALAADEVVAVLPVDRVGAAGAVLVVDVATVVGPEGVVEAVVVAGGGRSSGAGAQLSADFLELGGVEGHGEHAGRAEEERLERDHFGCGGSRSRRLQEA